MYDYDPELNPEGYDCISIDAKMDEVEGELIELEE